MSSMEKAPKSYLYDYGQTTAPSWYKPTTAPPQVKKSRIKSKYGKTAKKQGVEV